MLNIFQATFVFNLVATPPLLPTMTDTPSETSAFKFDILSEVLEIAQLHNRP